MKFLFLLLPFNLYAFTLNTSNAVSFDTDVIKVYVSQNDCAEISATADELESMTREAINQYWSRIPATSLNLEVVGKKSLDNPFRDEEVCSAVTPQGECTANENLKVDEGIIISCNTNAGNFGNGILGLSVPNNTTAFAIKGSIVLLNDTNASNPLASYGRDQIIDVIAHELGHAIGLGHTSKSENLMYFNVIEKRERLGFDDIAGVTYLYPSDNVFGTCASVAPIGGTSALAFFLGLFIPGLYRIKKRVKKLSSFLVIQKFIKRWKSRGKENHIS